MVERRVKHVVFFLIGLAFATRLGAQAEFTRHHGWIHLNGYSHHFAADDANDQLLGLGYTHYRRRYGPVIPAWEFDVFQDSGKKLSTYVGHSWTVPFKHLSAGVTAAVMYHRNFAAHNRLSTAPVAFPFLESRSERLKVRVYYIPPVRRASDQQIAVQILWAIRR